MYKDFREYLTALENKGLLKRVSKEVDPTWEIGTLTRTLFTDVPEKLRYGFLFEKVKGKKHRAATAVQGGSNKLIEVALGCPYEKRLERGVYALTHATDPLYAPKQVSDGPCKENILKGDKIRT